MKILVPIKRVLDFNVKVRIKPDNSDVDLSNAKMSMNPFDEIAVEEAIRMKEKGQAEEIVVVSVGATSSQETIRTALALGADRGILVEADNHLEPLNIAKCLKSIVEKESPRLVIMGKQSIDGDNNQTGQMLAGLLDWPQVTYASQVEFAGEEVQVIREIDGGLETLAVSLPAVVTTDLRLNEPRYASLPNIMKAKRKPLETLTPEALGVTFKEHIKVTKVYPPADRQAGVLVENVSELVDKLTSEAKVIG